MNTYISFRIDNHGQGAEVPKFGHIIGVSSTATLVLNNFEGGRRPSVVNWKGVGDLSICGSHWKITGNGEVRRRQCTE